MRAQLRTYHAIPSLQAQQDPNSYKQLQDAPRLKSILKGASEDRPEPNSIEKIKGSEIPRTNPVNLIFVLAQFAVMVTELHFPPGFDFYDLIMRNTLSSKSRARAFLWLMWHYLESDFTEEGAAENPFGPGVDYGTGEEASQEASRSKVDLEKGVANQGVPQFDVLTEEEAALENVDTAAEVEYGEAKMRERKRIIEADQAAFTADFGPPKRGPKPKLNLLPEEGASPSLLRARSTKYESDLDSTRSTPPPRVPNMRIQNVLNGSRSGRGSLKHQVVDSSSPAPSGLSAVAVPEGPSRRSRPLTAHQQAVERNRNQRVNYILSRGLRKAHHHARKARKVEGAILRAVHRTAHLHEEDMLADSESEENMMKPRGSFRERGLGGLIQLNTEEDDFGEELASYAAAFRRAGRRLDRWDGSGGRELGVMGTARIEKKEPVGDETEDEAAGDGEGDKDAARKDGVEDTIMEEDLDDMEKEILGIGSDDEGPDERDEDLDDMDKEILGIGGDETEEEQGSDGGMDVD
jgi:Ino eighty subunit 1